MSARSSPGGASSRSSSSIATARSTSPARRWRLARPEAPRSRQGRDRQPSARQPAPRAPPRPPVAPRAAACSATRHRDRTPPRRSGPSAASARWRARSSTSATAPGERPVHGLALPQRRALVADRSEKRMREADVRIVELDHRLLRRRLERLQNPARARRRWPPPARPSVARERRRAAGRRASRRGGAPTCLRAARSGSRARAAAGPAPVACSFGPARGPSSSAKNGLPAVASCTRASSGRVSSSPSRSSSR